MTENKRYKLVYRSEDAWEHEWDIEDTEKHIPIFQVGRIIVDELNDQDKEIKRLKKQNEELIQVIKGISKDSAEAISRIWSKGVYDD